MDKKTKALRSLMHHNSTVTDRQLKRMATGRGESRLTDYDQPHVKSKQQGVTRRAIEDMMMERELERKYGRDR